MRERLTRRCSWGRERSSTAGSAAGRSGAGAQFIVSPGLSEDVALLSAQADVPYLPGTVTPTGIMRALALGIDRIKFFPACNFGGLAGIKSLSAAFPQVRFHADGRR